MNHPAALKPGDTILLRGGTYRLDTSAEPDTSYWSVTGTAASPISVRAYPGERAIIDIDYQLQVYGAYTRYIGLEFTTLRTKKVFNSGWAPDRPGEFAVLGDNLKVINCIFHDMMGTSAFSSAENYEMYGNIMYYIGFIGPERSWGTTAYIQNISGRKDVTDNLMFQQFNHSLQVYGSDDARVKDVYMEGNTIFNPGSLGTNRGFNAIVWVGEQAVERIKFSDNYLYSPYADGTNLAFNGSIGKLNFDLQVINNHIIGGAPAFYTERWTPTVFTGNHLYSQAGLLNAILSTDRSQYNWNSNTYHYSVAGDAFTVNSAQTYNFNGWKQATGLDTNSTFTASRPTGMKVFVRPNKYEAGRAHITVINWDNLNTVTVSLANTGLAVGQQFEIRDAQNYFGAPVLTGTYNGAGAVLPLNLTAVSPILGAGLPINAGMVPPVHTPKEFNAFVVLPR